MYTSLLYKGILRKGEAVASEMYISYAILERINQRAHGFGENSNDY
jgi:hypothetical protein